MPKQIKKEQIKKSELLYRKWSVAGLAAAAVFMGCMAGLMSMIVKTEGAKVPTIVLFAAFVIYTAVSVVCAVLGVKSYVKDDCGVCLFQGIVHIYSVIACVMNVRMAFIILFSALGSQSGVDTLIGSQSQRNYFPYDTPITNYPDDFVQGCLIGAWEQMLPLIRENQKVPF